MAISIDAPIAEKWPTLTCLFNLTQIALHNDNLVPFTARTGKDFSEGTGNKGMTPEPEFSLPAHSIYRGDIDPVGHRMGTLDNFPGIALALCNSAGLLGNPANGCRIEKNLRPAE